MKEDRVRSLTRAVLKEWSDFKQHSEEAPCDEKREVQIGKEIITLATTRIRTTDPKSNSEFFAEQLKKCQVLAQELIDMHKKKSLPDYQWASAEDVAHLPTDNS